MATTHGQPARLLPERLCPKSLPNSLRATTAAKVRTELRTLAVPIPLVNKIIWAQAGRVTEPGRYMFKFGWLTITAEDLAVWQQYPNAAFTLLRTAPVAEAQDEFRLGTFELRVNISLREK
jgi:hypothetical protein